jgi:hypothetical protein
MLLLLAYRLKYYETNVIKSFDLTLNVILTILDDSY